eukprot:snap_masked-scaffold_77-processed-gene-0.18-mRNA-1 protein AED:1.00 eAED:1.00 QI:0/0/0/0/1/1/2/0/92
MDILCTDFPAYYAIYVLNRTTDGSRKISPVEDIYKKKPIEKEILIFGVKVINLINIKNKVESRGKYGLFIGYNYLTGEALIIDKVNINLTET